MNESLIIQSNIVNLPYVEERLFHFCSECNVGNYYSTVSMAVLQAVERAISCDEELSKTDNILIEMGNCRGGVFFEVKGAAPVFVISETVAKNNYPDDKSFFIIKSLSDRMFLSDDGKSIRLEFDVNGIDPADALERVSVVQSHFMLEAA